MLNGEAIATWEFSPSGGQDGEDFNDQSSLRNMASVPKLTSVVIQCDQYIDAIGFMLSAAIITLTPLTMDPTVGWRDSTVDGPSKLGLLGMHGGLEGTDTRSTSRRASLSSRAVVSTERTSTRSGYERT